MEYDKERIGWIDTAVTVTKIINARVAPVLSVSMVPSPAGDRCEICFLCMVGDSRIPFVVIAITGSSEDVLLKHALDLKRDLFNPITPVVLGQGGDA